MFCNLYVVTNFVACVINWLQLLGHLLLVVKKVADQVKLPNGYRVGL